MKRNYIKYLFLVCAATTLFAACRKDIDNSTETLQSGTTFIGIPEGMDQSFFYTPFTTTQAVDVFSIKKDAASNADLKKANTFVLTAIPDAITKFNDENGTEYEVLPTSIYTITNKAVTQTSTTLSFSFAPGDFVQKFSISIDGSKWDFSKKYAVAYKITSADGLAIHAASKDTAMVFFNVKNIYDGIYSMKGEITRNSATGPDATLSGHFTGLTNTLTTLNTTSNSFSQFWVDGSGVAGIAGLQLAVDPATNKVTVSATGNTTLKNTTGYNNHYDPATKTFYLGFDWGASPNTRIAVDTLTYTGQ